MKTPIKTLPEVSIDCTAKHTPGPWQVAGELDSLRVIQPESENPNSCDGIRQIAEIKQGDYEIPDYLEAAANARLIASAPDLLAALQSCEMALLGFTNRNKVIQSALDSARAAIAKAKGEK